MSPSRAYPSVSFDRAAAAYDQTRAFPPGIAQAVAEALRDHVPFPRAVLEIGVGTGRIARPLRDSGFSVVGLDLSRKMMARLLEEETGGSRSRLLAEGDASFLPFANRSFATVVAVHVFHLVGDLPACMQNVLRVLQRPGLVAVGWQWHPPGSDSARLREQWRLILEQQGADLSRPGLRGMGPALRLLEACAVRWEEEVAAEWEVRRSPSELIQEIGRRSHSSAWAVPDAIFPLCYREVTQWAQTALPDWMRPRAEKRRFIWRLFWF